MLEYLFTQNFEDIFEFLDLVQVTRLIQLIPRKFRPLNTDTEGAPRASKSKWRLGTRLVPSLGQPFAR